MEYNMRFEYKTIYYPTGSVSITSGEFDSEVDFLRYLNYWNRQAKGMYLYTTDYHSPVACAALDIDNMSIVIPGIREPSRIYKEDGWWTSLSTITADIISIDEFYKYIENFRRGMCIELKPDHYRRLFKKLSVAYTTINKDDPEFTTATEQFAAITIEYKNHLAAIEHEA